MLTLRLHAYWKVKRHLDRHLDADLASSTYAQLLKERMVPYVPGMSGSVELHLQSQQGHQCAAYHMHLKAHCLIRSTPFMSCLDLCWKTLQDA